MTEKKQRRKARNLVKQQARQILVSRFGIERRMLVGYAAISRYIRHYLPSTPGDGYALLFNFVGRSSDISPRKPQKKPPARTPLVNVNTGAFLSSYAWRAMRMQILKRDGARCACCGASPKDGVVMHVDHIKPRKLFPHLALEPDNLQVLCEVCNHGKGNWDQTDWRPDDPMVTELDASSSAHLGDLH